MSIEPTCDYCQAPARFRCRTPIQAAACLSEAGKTVDRPAGVLPDGKPTNPKDGASVHKLPLDLVPSSLKVFATLAFVEGAAKYGAYNWRVAGVRASIYKSAIERHLESWWNGEDADPTTGVPHLASILACAGILLDAGLVDKMTDDRPPHAAVGTTIREMESEVARIRALFADRDPQHCTQMSVS